MTATGEKRGKEKILVREEKSIDPVRD